MEGWKRGEGFCTILTVFHRSIHKNPRNLCNLRFSQKCCVPRKNPV